MTTELVDTATGEVLVRMTESEAEQVTASIVAKVGVIAQTAEDVIPMIVDAYRRQAHKALGFSSWESYVHEKFGYSMLRMSSVGNVSFRRTVVGELAKEGLSTRSIAPVVGASKDTVHRDLTAVSDETSERFAPTTGPDGKTYARSRDLPDESGFCAPPSPPQRRQRPWPDATRTARWKLDSAVTTIRNLAKDKRCAKHETHAVRLRNDIRRAINELEKIADQLPDGERL